MSISEAKRSALINVGSNIIRIAITSAIVLWQTPFLISKLGIAVYGLIPLIGSIVKYYDILTLPITSSVGRFVAFSFSKNKYERASEYLNTSLLSILALSAIIIFLSSILVFWLPKLISIPEGYENSARVFFGLVVITACLRLLVSPFNVSTFIRHKFYLSNSAQIVSRLFQLFALVFLFLSVYPSLMFVGISYIVGGSIFFIFSYLFMKYLTPQLTINTFKFSKDCFHDVAGMSIWALINHIGYLLHWGIDLIVINTLLGAYEGGRYAPILQWALLLNLLTNAISSVFSPIAYEYVAKKEYVLLFRQTTKIIRYIGVILGLPIAVICGFSYPLLTRWLGAEFSDLWPLLILLLAPGLINYSIRPIFAIQRGLNKVKVPALVTFLGGGINIFLSIYFVKYTSLGIYGVGAATMISLLGKNLFFVPIHIAYLLRSNVLEIYLALIPGIGLSLITFFIAFHFSDLSFLVSYLNLVVAGISMGLIYLILVLLVFRREDWEFFKGLLTIRK